MAERWVTINGHHVLINDNEEYVHLDDKTAKKEYSKYDYDVTSKEWKDSTKYTGGQHYMAIQKALYEGNRIQDTYRDGKQDMTPYIENLDRSMRPLSQNTELFRTLTYDNWERSIGLDINTVQSITEGSETDTKILDSMIGKTFNPKGYTSTSYNPEQNAMAGAQVMIKFLTPKGTPSIVTSNKMESEVILHRGLKYQIIGYDLVPIAGTRKQLVVKARVLKG